MSLLDQVRDTFPVPKLLTYLEENEKWTLDEASSYSHRKGALLFFDYEFDELPSSHRSEWSYWVSMGTISREIVFSRGWGRIKEADNRLTLSFEEEQEAIAFARTFQQWVDELK